MRKYLYVTTCYGDVLIHARDRADADEEFGRRGYLVSDIMEVR